MLKKPLRWRLQSIQYSRRSLATTPSPGDCKPKPKQKIKEARREGRLFVGNLPLGDLWSWTKVNSQLIGKFNKLPGYTGVDLPVDPFNKQESDASQGHLGHAFIKFASEPLAKQAVEPVRGIELQGSPLRVQVADGKPGVRLRLSDVPEIGPSQWSHLFEELPGLERIEHVTGDVALLEFDTFKSASLALASFQKNPPPPGFSYFVRDGGFYLRRPTRLPTNIVWGKKRPKIIISDLPPLDFLALDIFNEFTGLVKLQFRTRYPHERIAVVEYKTLEQAKRVKESLDRRWLFPGGSLLKVDYAPASLAHQDAPVRIQPRSTFLPKGNRRKFWKKIVGKEKGKRRARPIEGRGVAKNPTEGTAGLTME